MAESGQMRHHGHMSSILRLGVLGLALVAASCGVSGPPRPGTTPDEMAAPLTLPTTERGVVVGLRSVTVQPASNSRQQTVAQLMRVSTGGGAAVPASAVEVIVRLERGNRDIAFVRGAEEGFRLGQRVTLSGGDHPELRGGG